MRAQRWGPPVEHGASTTKGEPNCLWQGAFVFRLSKARTDSQAPGSFHAQSNQAPRRAYAQAVRRSWSGRPFVKLCRNRS